MKTLHDHGVDPTGSPLRTTASKVPIHTIATEILRCHPRRPGLLSVAGGRNKLTHLDPTIAAGDAAQEAGIVAFDDNLTMPQPISAAFPNTSSDRINSTNPFADTIYLDNFTTSSPNQSFTTTTFITLLSTQP